MTIVNPAQFPDRSVVSEYLEPMVLGTILAPDSYTGKIMSLCLVRENGICEHSPYYSSFSFAFLEPGSSLWTWLLSFSFWIGLETKRNKLLYHTKYPFCTFFSTSCFRLTAGCCVFKEPQSRAEEHGVHRRPARYDEVSLPTKWSRCGFLRPPQIAVIGIRQVKLTKWFCTHHPDLRFVLRVRNILIFSLFSCGIYGPVRCQQAEMIIILKLVLYMY